MKNKAAAAEAVRILLIEDNAADVDLMKYALDEGHFRYELSTLTDGEEALAFIRREGKYADAMRNRPDCDGPALAEERWNGSSAGDSREYGIRRSPGRRFEFLRVSGGEKTVLRVRDNLPHPETKQPGCVFESSEKEIKQMALESKARATAVRDRFIHTCAAAVNAKGHSFSRSACRRR